MSYPARAEGLVNSTIALVFVTNHYDIDGLHVFWDTLNFILVVIKVLLYLGNMKCHSAVLNSFAMVLIVANHTKPWDLWLSSTLKSICSSEKYVARLFMRLWNYIQSEEKRNISTHQLTRYYLPQRVLTTARIALVPWYTRRKSIRIKILQNWLTREQNHRIW